MYPKKKKIIIKHATRLPPTSTAASYPSSSSATRSGAPTCVSARVAFKVKGVIEALAARDAQKPFKLAVTLHVTHKQTLDPEALITNMTAEVVLSFWRFCGGKCH